MISLQSCLYGTKLPENFDELDVILINSESKQSLLTIDNESKKKIYTSLKKSTYILDFQVIKEALKEGEYLIKVKKDNTVYSFTLINSENIFNNENKKFYRNTELREILIGFINRFDP